MQGSIPGTGQNVFHVLQIFLPGLGAVLVVPDTQQDTDNPCVGSGLRVCDCWVLLKKVLIKVAVSRWMEADKTVRRGILGGGRPISRNGLLQADYDDVKNSHKMSSYS